MPIGILALLGKYEHGFLGFCIKTNVGEGPKVRLELIEGIKDEVSKWLRQRLIRSLQRERQKKDCLLSRF